MVYHSGEEHIIWYFQTYPRQMYRVWKLDSEESWEMSLILPVFVVSSFRRKHAPDILCIQEILKLYCETTLVKEAKGDKYWESGSIRYKLDRLLLLSCINIFLATYCSISERRHFPTYQPALCEEWDPICQGKELSAACIDSEQCSDIF